MDLILASASPRRSELLKAAGIPFRVVVSEVDETIEDISPDMTVKSLALRKCIAVANRIAQTAAEMKEAADAKSEDPIYVLGADTVVAAGDTIFGKPQDAAEAFQMIRTLSGESHSVFTGIAIARVDGESVEIICNAVEETKVFVTSLSDAEIDDYLEQDEYADKAGAYAIQGLFSKYIEKIEGDYANVVGLPIHLVWKHLRRISSE